MRLLVCGSRTWGNRKAIRRELEKVLFQVECVIEGEAKGADSIALEEAVKLGMFVEQYPANWKKYGRAAGPIRNQQMIDEGKPTHAFAFHEDIENSKGTKDMVKRLKKYKIPVTVFKG